MVTIKEVAARARASTGTVSNVLRNVDSVRPEFRARVLKAIHDLKYEPNHVARSLKSRRTYTLGMVIPDITDPFFPQLTRGAEDAAVEKNYVLMTVNTDNQVERERLALESFKRRQIDGVLLVMAPNSGRSEHVRSVLSAGIPVVCLDRIDRKLGVSSVGIDAGRAAEMCIEHLVGCGHKDIAIINGDLQTVTARDRFWGYKKVLRRAKIPLDHRFVFDGDFRFESGYWLTRQMWASSHKPTALFVCNAMMGLGAFKALREMGVRCPQDLAVATFDDLPQGESFSPPVTAVVQPSYAIGRKGAELLIDLIEKPKANARPITLLCMPNFESGNPRCDKSTREEGRPTKTTSL